MSSCSLHTKNFSFSSFDCQNYPADTSLIFFRHQLYRSWLISSSHLRFSTSLVCQSRLRSQAAYQNILTRSWRPTHLRPTACLFGVSDSKALRRSFMAFLIFFILSRQSTSSSWISILRGAAFMALLQQYASCQQRLHRSYSFAAFRHFQGSGWDRSAEIWKQLAAVWRLPTSSKIMAPVSQWFGQLGLFLMSSGSLMSAYQYLPEMQRRLSYEISFCSQVIDCELFDPLQTSITSQNSNSYSSSFYQFIMLIFEQLDAFTLVVEYLEKSDLLRLSLLSSRTRHLLNSHPQISINLKKYRVHLMKNVVRTNYQLLKKDRAEFSQIPYLPTPIFAVPGPAIGRNLLPSLSALFKQCWLRRKQALQQPNLNLPEKSDTNQKSRKKRQISMKNVMTQQDINRTVEKALELHRQQMELKNHLHKIGKLMKKWTGLNNNL